MHASCVWYSVQVTIAPIDCLPYTTMLHIQLSVIRDAPLDIGRGDEIFFFFATMFLRGVGQQTFFFTRPARQNIFVKYQDTHCFSTFAAKIFTRFSLPLAVPERIRNFHLFWWPQC